MTNDLKRQVRDYTEFFVSTVDPVAMDEITDRPVGDGPVRPLAPVRMRRRGGIMVAVAAAAAVVLALGAVALFAGIGEAPTQDQPDPTTPTTTAAPDTTLAPDTTIPDTTIPRGPLDVHMEWTEVPHDRLPVDSASQWFVIEDGATPRIAIVGGADESTQTSLWTSVDGIGWEETPTSLPVALGDVRVGPSGYWQFEPGVLWYSPDLVSGWEPIDVDGLSRAELYPMVGEPTVQGVAKAGDTTLVAVQYSLEFDWDQLLGIEPGTYDDYNSNYEGDEESAEEIDRTQLDPTVTLSGRNELEPVDSSGNPIDELWSSEPLLRFIPVTSADGLTLVDADTGEVLFEFPNYQAFDWNDVVGQDVFPRFHTQLATLLAVTGDGVEPVGPWSGELGSTPGPGSIRLIELSEGAIVTSASGLGQQDDGYLTRDGATFEAVSMPDAVYGIAYDPASGYLYTPHIDPWFGDEYHWISPDGIGWTPLDTIPTTEGSDPAAISTLNRVAGAWLVIKSGAEEGSASISVDGKEWLAMSEPAPSWNGRLPVAWGDRVLIIGEDSIWIGQAFDD